MLIQSFLSMLLERFSHLHEGSTTYQGHTKELQTFYQYGILIQSLYVAVWKECGDLKPEHFTEVLLHFYLAAEVHIENESICSSRCKQYFIPAILKLCHNDTAVAPHSKEMASPLHIIFDTHFVSPGFSLHSFCCCYSYSCQYNPIP